MKNVPMTRRILNLLLAVLSLLLPGLAFAEDPMPTTIAPARGAMEFKAGEIIVKFKEGISQASVQSSLLADELEILDEMGQLGIMLLSVPEGQELEKIEELKRNPLVEYAEPNHMIQVTNALVAEPHYGLRAPDVFPNDPILQWNLPQIEAFAAWDITTGSEKVVIAFVDSGVDLCRDEPYPCHDELKDKIWTNPTEKIGDANGDGFPGIQGVDDDEDGLIDEDSRGRQPGDADYTNDLKDDDDENGYADDFHGWDFVNKNGEPQDDFWIGTFMSSIAAAKTDNGILIAGVSWGAEIMPIKVIQVVDDIGYLWDWYSLDGIIYAADNGAKIIDLSWSLRSVIDPQLLQLAIDYAHDKDVLIVAGSGYPNPNDPIPPDAYQYPAALDHVVSVAATDYYDERPDFSTYNDKVDIAAPGVGIPGVYKEYYGFWSDTGVAAAQVAGLAALIWSVNPHLTPEEVEDIIESTAVDLGEDGRDDYFGWGRIDANAAVRATPHYLEVKTDAPLDFLVCDDGNPSPREITNPNTGYSTWSATAIDSWLSISDPEGNTPSSVMVSIDKGSLPGYDVYTAAITATSTMTSCENCLRMIPVTAAYTQCWRSYLPLLFKQP